MNTGTGLNAAIDEVVYEAFANDFTYVVDRDASVRLLSTGHWWAEGPAWDAERGRLYFTDVPRNRAYAWSQDQGGEIFMYPSGAPAESVEGMREPGANGLLLSSSGELLICNHGERAVEARSFETGQRRTLADRFEGKRFNSPNDLIEASDGTVYFTDPPYGLEGLNSSPLKEMSVNGVYRLDPDGQIIRLVDDMTFPNGVVLSPDERWLYVSQSDPDAPLVRRFELARATGVGDGETWFDAQPFMHEVGGLPDGMAVAASGHVFLAGPGGVLVVSPAGECLGRIFTGRPSANCAFGEDGRTLFITAQDRLLAVRTKVTGLGRF
ncbi:MAG: SMP-30/gluconolactonase/LRE family protein [Pseudomonadota bacterium]